MTGDLPCGFKNLVNRMTLIIAEILNPGLVAIQILQGKNMGLG